MTPTDSRADDARQPRKRGAPKGNRNAWKHGGRSAAGKAKRESARAELISHLPDADVLRPSLEFASAAYAQIAREVQIAQNLPNKTNNSLARPDEGEGGTHFSPNKANNFVAREGTRKRGAPKGNRNALKHGMKSAERRAFNADLRQFIQRVEATCALALALGTRTNIVPKTPQPR
ncbi:MAG TPA: hypothetical protein VHW69_12325 [Rhizomicrobium sp.]|jgi:uncharacterized protein YjcR|nr:hypothetical protein [Rhizomicrobium sp.]